VRAQPGPASIGLGETGTGNRNAGEIYGLVSDIRHDRCLANQKGRKPIDAYVDY
jgi:hypothetical protein